MMDPLEPSDDEEWDPANSCPRPAKRQKLVAEAERV